MEYMIEGNENIHGTSYFMSVWYDVDRRSVVVRRLGEPLPDPSRRTARTAIPRTDLVIAVRNIHRIVANPFSLCIVFDLRAAATFEVDDPSNFDDLHFGLENNRLRARSFDSAHSRLAAFTSSQIMLQFSEAPRFGTFLLNLRETPHIAPIFSDEQHSFKIVGGEVYAVRWMHTLQNHYMTLPLQIALSCEQAVWNGAVLPEDMLHYLDPLKKGIVISGVDAAALTLQNIISMSGPPVPLERTRKGKRNAEQRLRELDGQARADALDAKLAEAAKFAVMELKYRKRFTNPDSALCHQVYATPSGFIFEREWLTYTRTGESFAC